MHVARACEDACMIGELSHLNGLKAAVKQVVQRLGLLPLYYCTLGKGYPDMLREVVQTPIVKEFAPPQPGRLLDVGAGEGLNTVALARRAKWVVAVDIGAMDRLRARLPAELANRVVFVIADAQALPFRDSAFDTIVCTEVLEHLHDDTSTLQRLAQLLRPSGSLILSVPVPPAPVPDEHHIREGYHLTDLRRFCVGAGLAVRRHRYCLMVVARGLIKILKSWHYLPAGLVYLGAWLDYCVPRRLLFRPYDIVIQATPAAELCERQAQEGAQAD